MFLTTMSQKKSACKKRFSDRITFAYLLTIAFFLFGNHSFAEIKIKSCYEDLDLENPNHKLDALYIFIDQTTYLTKAMKKSVTSLISDWGENGDRVKILRFSANVKGQFTELMFNETVDAMPSQEYLFHLRTKDKKNLLKCLQRKATQFKTLFKKTLTDTLKMTKNSLPKTDLLYSLKLLASKTMAQKDEHRQTVLIITDGLENSDYLRFHGKGTVKKVRLKRSLKKLKKHKLIANWNNADIYMYGLGHISNADTYIRPKLIAPLRNFWQAYFNKGKGKVKQLGTPEILLSTIKTQAKF